MKFKLLTALLCASLLLGFTACGKTEVSGTGDSTAEADTAATAISAVSAKDMFSDRDLEIGYSEYVTVNLADEKIAANGEGVTVEDNSVTVTQEGTYLFKGALSNGQIIVDAADKKLQLVLDGVSISNQSSAAIYVKQADKVFITTAANSENELSVTGEYVQKDDNNIDAVIFSKDDLTLNGAGSLSINAQYGAGVVSKNDLVVGGGSYTVSAAGHALNGKDSVRIAAGTFAITSGKDGVHSENADDTNLGFTYIADGSFKIESADDGVFSFGNLTIQGGAFEITAADGAFKCDSAVTVTDGNISILKCSEGIEGQSVEISDGYISIIAADDGINAAKGKTLSAETEQETQNTQNTQNTQTEQTTSEIQTEQNADNWQENPNGANNRMFPGGKMEDAAKMANDPDCKIIISGGYISINAYGDGLDSNGSVEVSGGELYISGPTSGADSALDYNGDAVITGGVVIAAGSTGMAQNFGSSSVQGTMLVTFEATQKGKILLCDESGEILAEYTPEKEYQCAVISAPEIAIGKTYTVTAGDETQTIEMTQLVYGSGGMGGGMQHQGGGKGQMMPPNGELPEGMTPPEGDAGHTAPAQDAVTSATLTES